MLASTQFDLGAECRLASDRFREAFRAIAPGRPEVAPDPGLFPENVVFYLPYALADAFPFEGALEAVRTMVLGNLLGEVHFLVEDRHLDADGRLVGEAMEAGGPTPGDPGWPTPADPGGPTPADPGGPAPETFPPDSGSAWPPIERRFSDLSLLMLAREYSRLFPPESPFWGHFWRHLREYFASLDWEFATLRDVGGLEAVSVDQLDHTLLMLGRRISPLKACAAAVTLLADREEALPAVERVVEDYHAAYQLSDDLEDLAVDLETGAWSATAWLIAARAGLSAPSELRTAERALASAATTGALDQIVGLIRSRFESAADGARALGAPLLESYLEGCLERSRRVHRWVSRRLKLASCGGRPDGPARSVVFGGRSPGPTRDAAAPDLHSFAVGDDGFVFDPESGLLFHADELAMDVLGWMRDGCTEAALSALEMNHGAGPLGDALSELSILRGEEEPPAPSRRAGVARIGQSLSRLVSVALNVSGDCNLRCDYCYLERDRFGRPRLMTEETADLAIDLLFEESFGASEVSVVFFGGEPLLNVPLIDYSVRLARARAYVDGRRVSFHMTTNGTLLSREVAERLADIGVSVLVSIDGAREEHDAHRRTSDGAGSYDAIAANVSAASEFIRPGARATVTEDSRPLGELVGHLRELGFGVVHLAPVSGGRTSPAFAERLVRELEELARQELRALEAGGAPSVGNFIEPMISLELGRQRLLPCGAGARYVSVDHDGRLFLCHRFAGDGRYMVGDVRTGLDRSAVGALLARLEGRSVACRSCWARDLCGGACFYDVELAAAESADGAADHLGPRCRVTRRVLELSMWLYASLPPERRAGLAEAARRLARPEVLSGRGS